MIVNAYQKLPIAAAVKPVTSHRQCIIIIIAIIAIIAITNRLAASNGNYAAVVITISETQLFVLTLFLSFFFAIHY